MTPDFTPERRRELLDDFYAECDELLTAIREELAQLEESGGGAPAAQIEELFRHAHTFKGISSMVGLRPAEALAHAMEDLLRALTKRQVAVAPGVVDELLRGARRLEEIVSAHRREEALPEIRDLLALYRSRLPAATGATANAAPSAVGACTAADPDKLARARAEGRRIFHARFAPAVELDQRGVNVASVRQRLEALGGILHATPIVQGPGRIAFVFTVGLREPLPDFAPWAVDGVVFEAAPEPKIPEAATANGAADLALTPSHLVRVDLAKLDELMRIAGELVIHRSRLEDRLLPLGTLPAGLREASHALGRSLREMREAIGRVRTVPIAELFTRMPFVVRDLMRHSDKRARVLLEGSQTEVDKFFVERLREPLLHLVRNAFAHGIEEPAARRAAGKPPEATILLRARSAGEYVVIQVRDDGAGIDAAKVAGRAQQLGFAVPAEPDAAALLAILCTPGFSTRDAADHASGRGVGMAVVEKTVRDHGGTLTLETTPGRGTEFTLRLPLTLAIADAIMVEVNGQKCAIPQSSVDEIVQVPVEQVRQIQRTEVVPYRDGLLPVVRLRSLFRLPPAADARPLTILVVGAERGSAGLAVDRVFAQREIVMRPLADPLVRVPGISGATELGDGKPILILDAAAILQGAVRPPAGALKPAPELVPAHLS